MVRAAVLLVLALHSAACGLLGPDEVRRRGDVLEGFDNEVPDSVRAGEPFDAVIYTYGSCMRVGDTVVTMTGPHMARVEPYDIDILHGNVCPSVLHAFSRRVSLTFDAPGEAVVVIIGHDGYHQQRALTELRYTVRVY